MRGIVGLAVTVLLGLISFVPGGAVEEYDPFIRCYVAAETPFVRGEGLSERIGDVRLVCNGGNPDEVRFLSLFVLSNTAFTSDIVDPATGETEALLLIDDPLPGVMNISNRVTYDGQVRGVPNVLPGDVGGPGAEDSGNVYPGFRGTGGMNRIEWDGIPFRPAPPGLARVIRLVNIRVDATQFQATLDKPKAIRVNLATAMQNMIPIGETEVTAGYAAPSFRAESRLDGANFEIILQEHFSEAFRKRIANGPNGINDVRQQGLVADPFNTESGFTPDYGGLAHGAPGVADHGTRFLARFDGMMPGVHMTVPSRIISDNLTNEPTEIELRRVMEYAPDFSGGVLAGENDPDELVPMVDGAGSVLYEVVARAPYEGMTGRDITDRFRIPFHIVLAQPTDIGSPSVVVNYAPVDSTRTMSSGAPEPRFYSDTPAFLFPVEGGSIQQYVRMRYTPSDELPVVTRFKVPGDLVASNSLKVIDGDDWLSVTPEFSPLTERLIVAGNPAGFAPGRYHGAISLRQEGNAQPLRIVPVVLDVNPPPELLVDTAELLIRATVGAGPPPQRNIFVNGRNKAFRFEVGVSTASGGDWLAATPLEAPTPAYVAVTVDHTGLIPGRYEGALSIRAAVASNSPRLIPVVLEVAPPQPVFDKTSIGNAASYEANGLSPGEIFMIFGSNVGPDVPAGIRLGENGRVATVTGGTRILIDGVPSPMVLASKTQSGGVAPYNIAGKAVVNVQIEQDGWKSEAVTVPVLAAKPGIFSSDSSGTGQGAILNEDGALNSPSNPAKVGSVVTAYVTGVGLTDPPVFDGWINSGPNFPKPVAPALVRIGGVEAVIEFIGGAPGLVAGAIQVNVRVTGTPGEKVPFQVVIGGRVSNTVYLSIEQ